MNDKNYYFLLNIITCDLVSLPTIAKNHYESLGVPIVLISYHTNDSDILQLIR